MANDPSNVRTSDTLQSLKAERKDLEQTIASMRQMARDLDAMKGRKKSFDPERVAAYLQMKGPDMRLRIWAGIRSPEGFQWHKEWMARKKAKAEQSLLKLAAFTQAVILWAEDLERRESRYRNVPPALGLLAPSGPSDEISAPSFEGAAVGEEATGSALTGASALSAAAAGVVVTAAEVVIYGAYKGAVEPGIKAWADASNVHREQSARRVYDIDHDPDSENTPQKGWILYDGESRRQDGTIRSSNGQIVVDANGNSVLSVEERRALGQCESVWDLPPSQRGIVIEKTLAATEYRDWHHIGRTNYGYFPLIDFQNGNTVVSLKTANTDGTEWINDLRGHIRVLGATEMTIDAQPANKVLDLRVQPGGVPAAKSLVSYGAQFGIQVIVKGYP